MKIKTKCGAAYIYFAYESPDGYEKFRSFDEATKEWDETFLTGYCYNPFYNCCERIDEVCLRERPSISFVKQFIRECFNIMKD